MTRDAGSKLGPGGFWPAAGQSAGRALHPALLVLPYCDLGVEGLTPETASRAVRAVLAQQAYRPAAGQMRAEINALPDADHAVALLERLGTERQPILAG
jgi:hypothetical protein